MRFVLVGGLSRIPTDLGFVLVSGADKLSLGLDWSTVELECGG